MLKGPLIFLHSSHVKKTVFWIYKVKYNILLKPILLVFFLLFEMWPLEKWNHMFLITFSLERTALEPHIVY